MRTGCGILHGIFKLGSHRSIFKHHNHHQERVQHTGKGDRWFVNIDPWSGSTTWSVKEGKPDQLDESARRPSRCVEACSILRGALRRGGDNQFLDNKKHIWDKEIFNRWARKWLVLSFTLLADAKTVPHKVHQQAVLDGWQRVSRRVAVI